MKLEKLTFKEKLATDLFWEINECTFDQINLVVGKNATGKTKTLAAINALANLVSGDKEFTFDTGRFEAYFKNKDKDITYILSYKDFKIVEEKYSENGKILLEREQGKKGSIYTAEVDKFLKFQIPDDQLACLVKMDEIQHPFLKDLYNWGTNSRFYQFGTFLGKNLLVVFTKDFENKVISPKDADNVVAILRKGFDKHSEHLKNTIVDEMNKIGFNIIDIGISSAEGLTRNLQSDLQCIFVQELGLTGKTQQIHISQGMFRALSLIIQINVSLLDSEPSCILIDDVGEGLDYERSTTLINLIIEKTRDTDIQIIMSSNDRFVMNAVPIKYWCVIQREDGKCKIFNYRNSKEIFEDFKFTGLANFDFLKSEFYLKGFDAQ